MQCNATQHDTIQYNTKRYIFSRLWSTNNISWWIAVSSITDPVTICVNLLYFTRETRVPVIFQNSQTLLRAVLPIPILAPVLIMPDTGVSYLGSIIWINKRAGIQDDRGYRHHFNFVYSNILSIEISRMLLPCHRTNVSAPLYCHTRPASH